MSKVAKMEVKGLSHKDVYIIGELAKEKRRMFDIGMGPLGDNIFKLIRKIGIYLIYYPIPIDNNQENPFSAVYLSSEQKGEKINFIGLNTQDYYDKQIFALGHELYHYFEKAEIHVCRISDGPQSYPELKANRFAAEFLLPTDKLVSEVQEINNGDIDLKKWKLTALLRFVARLHCEYRLPYKAIVRRLLEIESIDRTQFDKLVMEPVRTKESLYYRIGMNMDATVFELLNTPTHKSGVDGEDLNKILSNFESGLISEAELSKDLFLFGKTLAEFGLEEPIMEKDLEGLDELYIGDQ
jgi:Zn-dependent peptidase ImmA (M78 family)